MSSTPTLSPLSASSSRGEPTTVPPPPWFKPVYTPRAATYLGSASSHAAPRGDTAARRAGLRYERKALEHLKGLWSNASFQASPILSFADAIGKRNCIPDAILLDVDFKSITIFEIKSRHTNDSWWQLRKLYQPVVEIWMPDISVQVVEVCGSYDPTTRFNEPVELLADLNALKSFIFTKSQSFGVYRWTP